MGLQEAIEILKAKREERLPLFMDVRVIYRAIDTVLAELDRLQIENKEKEEIIKDMQDELKHIPSIVSETM